MILVPLSEAKLNGTGGLHVASRIIGGILVTADGTNDATIVIRRENSSGAMVFHLVTKSPAFIAGPIFCNTQEIYVSCTGTGAGVFLYEWIN
jgi:hypothetical protein